jgi:hypothetical protein
MSIPLDAKLPTDFYSDPPQAWREASLHKVVKISSHQFSRIREILNSYDVGMGKEDIMENTPIPELNKRVKMALVKRI